MDRPFTTVTSRDDVEQLFARSAERPVIVFKHDTTCSISRAAYGEMEQVTEDVAIVDVDHDVSGEVAERTGVQHESPQVIVVRDGQAIWSASHHDITQAAVERAVAEASENSAR